MGFRVESDEIVVQISDDRVIAGSDVVEWRIFNHITAVTHRIFDALHRVARCAGEACLRGRCVEVFSDGSVHHAVKQDRWVVTAAAPLGGLDTVDLLHIDN